MPPVTLLIKPVSGACNMNCTYCFYRDVTQNRSTPSYGVMSTGTLTAVLSKALAFADGSCTLAFQGGEPTLAGLTFYQRASELVKQLNFKKLPVYYALQTNGLALDAEWAQFLAEHRFLVGLSLDGIKETHDRYRTDLEGKGTFARVWKAAGLLSRYHIPYNILTVVNAATARHPQQIYSFYKKNGFETLKDLQGAYIMGKKLQQRK